MPTFIHDFWESNTGPCVCKGKSLASKLSPQPYFQFFARDGGNIQLSSSPIAGDVLFLAVFSPHKYLHILSYGDKFKRD